MDSSRRFDDDRTVFDPDPSSPPMSEPNDVDLTAHHTGITVRDLDESIEFYRDVLGLEVAAEFTLSDEEFAAAVAVEGATGKFAHLDAGGSRVELIEYEPEGETVGETMVNQPGAKHLGLATDDVDGFYEGLPESVEALSEPRTTGSGSRILFVRDPEGNLVELVES
ncbi:Glyoxalase/bleomycin resistance protein/dioxygenase [Halococcus hamelinensis 100A6]|uniref:Glyoxalase/bleomycin resistance protein/dioxygenase n=2 Tax=Halococcus hamelinensis TaxID=332168 RepID=M0LW27_9EURY|nr:Glyoxalase/bleomycin resistance protein/dioxygenase [Halococcus hamelinensis 100A6]